MLTERSLFLDRIGSSLKRLSCLKSCCAWLVIVAGISGCSGGGPEPTYSVTGTVKLSDGTPLSGGRILARPNENSKYSARGEVNSDGTFILTTFEVGDGAIEGTHKVMISPSVTRESLDEIATRGKRPKPTIDQSYQSLRTTPLSITVTSDGSSENHFDLVVEPPSGKPSRRRSR